MTSSIARTVLVLLVVVTALGLLPAPAEAQGDGPHNLPLAPVGVNVLAPIAMGLSGNFNPQQTVLVPGANVDIFAVPLSYMRTFPFGGRFGRLFVTVPLATLDAAADVANPGTGGNLTVTRGRSGSMDPIVTMHVGLVGTPALKLPEFVKHPPSFQMVGIVGASIPIGTYDANRLINLGTNRWSFRLGVGTVTPFSKAWAWESANSVFLFTRNDDVFGPANARSQDPLFVSENHLTRTFSPKWWGSIDLRYQVGGETSTDGIPDGNLTNILGGGVSLGTRFTRHLGGYGSVGRVLAKKGDAREWMLRYVFNYSF